ncbi:hypothetical protein [Bacillus badius]|uniref:ABC transporter periplasmic binding protein yphF n=1 Tax=Bacillus badius TaxID=1455 RepID=A0ABR5AYS0_BACBA|nr:hypothetical protein [Bacillus badius]KIL75142.1 ABC transporter periplasmic binding protein yphF [Bacillus badius]KIL79871.1 ABC transporter periplasmic binding protein yphF [Bacillus badius]KZR60247.1 hypothetical protein A3781_08665 [Bacillus badius]MED4715051.1 hypothetical protein [Bacillus badius]
MKKLAIVLIVTLVSAFMSGCMFPDDQRAENKVPYEDQIRTVQSAVDQFKEANGGILPIKTKEADTPLYEKYPIDFKKIAPQYMAEPPGNAFESGGVFQYTLVDVEKNPTVKLIDLRMAEQIRDVQLRIRSQGYPPFKDKIANNVFSLDFKKIGFKEEPYVVSPYTQQNLPLVISGDGRIYVDYSSDLYAALKKSKAEAKQGEDIRTLLLEDSPFAPGFSLPYTVNDKNEPIFMVK